jgi:hypothetical protein
MAVLARGNARRCPGWVNRYRSFAAPIAGGSGALRFFFNHLDRPVEALERLTDIIQLRLKSFSFSLQISQESLLLRVSQFVEVD